MSNKKVNLEDILIKNIKKIYTELKPVEDFCNRDRIITINAMKEACRQTLELAAENAETEKEILPECGVLKSVGVVNKQSILDTINQVK